MAKKLKDLAVFIEFLVGSGLALFFHLVLNNTQSALIIFGIGILLSLATYILREEIEQTGKKLSDQYDHAHEITFTISRMKDPECQAKAHEIMSGAKRSLALLQQGYIPLDETEFYMKGAKYMSESRHKVTAIDPVTAGWDSRGALINFYQANLKALERGVKITRIFVINRDEMNDPTVQKVILSQIRDGIDARIAYRDELTSTSEMSVRDTACSFDFAIYDDQVATEVFSQPGKYFGRKTRVPELVGNYQQLFGLIDHVSHALTINGERVILAADQFSLAS